MKGARSNKGTVQVVYRGPAVESFKRNPHTGELTIYPPVDNGHGGDAPMGAHVPRDRPSVFFCRALPATYASPPPRLVTGRPGRLEVIGLASSFFPNSSRFVRSDVGGEFADFDALYRYLRDVYRVPLPPTLPEGP